MSQGALMDKYDALFFFGAILALCGAILAAPLQLQGGNNPGIVLLLAGIVVMIVGIALKFLMKS
jgi:hypothetical protein